MSDTPARQSIPRQTLRRLPYYANYLRSDACAQQKDISARRIAQALGLSEILVRKDLAAVSSVAGKPKVGFDCRQLLTDMESLAGVHRTYRAVLVGTGRLGSALLHFEALLHGGVEIAAAFDLNRGLEAQRINGISILPMEQLTSFCADQQVRIGIIAVPESSAQAICDQLVAAGVLAIWNFAPVRLRVPKHILMRTENMAGSLTMLSHELALSLGEEEG